MKTNHEVHVAESLLGIAHPKSTITLGGNLTPLQLLDAVDEPISGGPLLPRHNSPAGARPRTSRYPPSHFHSQPSDFIQTQINWFVIVSEDKIKPFSDQNKPPKPKP